MVRARGVQRRSPTRQGGQWPRELRDQIVCEARGSARGAYGASCITLLNGPRGSSFLLGWRAIITDLIKMKSETGHVGSALQTEKRRLVGYTDSFTHRPKDRALN